MKIPKTANIISSVITIAAEYLLAGAATVMKISAKNRPTEWAFTMILIGVWVMSLKYIIALFP